MGDTILPALGVARRLWVMMETFGALNFMVRFEVEDHTGTMVFVALDSEVQAATTRDNTDQLVEKYAVCYFKNNKNCRNLYIFLSSFCICRFKNPLVHFKQHVIDG
ncbi:hypothetical protein MKW92_004096 [Papaver armeniacum]|nr:hypothetical protein MKW92_004096 [Papaver armeniacum]